MTGYASIRDRLRSDPRRDAHLDAPQWPVRRMATRAGTLARIRARAAAPAIVEKAGRHAGRLTGGAPRRASAADGIEVACEPHNNGPSADEHAKRWWQWQLGKALLHEDLLRVGWFGPPFSDVPPFSVVLRLRVRW